jgi:hypothetical protein
MNTGASPTTTPNTTVAGAGALRRVLLIQTRFSIADALTQTYKITRALATPGDADTLKAALWAPSRLSRKLAVFNAMTAPCVRAQTHPSWEWRIYTSADLPCLDALRALAAADSRITIHFVLRTPDDLVADANAWLSEAALWGDGRVPLGTMRLDDDDGLPPTALAEAAALLDTSDPPPFAGFKALYSLVLSDGDATELSVSRIRDVESRFVLASGLTALCTAAGSAGGGRPPNVHAAGNHATLMERARVHIFESALLQTSDPLSCDTARQTKHSADKFIQLQMADWVQFGSPAPPSAANGSGAS